MMYYFKNIKNFKDWGYRLKMVFIADLVRNLLFMLLGVGLYLLLNNTGLLVYLIWMIKYHWLKEGES